PRYARAGKFVLRLIRGYSMMKKRLLSTMALSLTVLMPLAARGDAQADKPKVQIPQPGVPQIMTLEGRYVRAAYNNEGYAILGYKLVNLSVGEEWMLLEVGGALRAGGPDSTLTPGSFSLDTPEA